MNITDIKIRKKENHGRLKAVVTCLLAVLFLKFAFSYVQYLMYMTKLEIKKETQKQEIIAFQENLHTFRKKQSNVFAKIDGVEVQAVPVICTAKDNVFYEVLPQSKFLLNKETSASSEKNYYYENLFSEYILAKNHFENMDYFSYIKYKHLKNNN